MNGGTRKWVALITRRSTSSPREVASLAGNADTRRHVEIRDPATASFALNPNPTIMISDG